MAWTLAHETIAARGLDSPWEAIILRETGGNWSLGALVRAIIAIESNWINGRINPADPSYGLMQIHYPGGAPLAPGVRPEDLQWNADANLRTGIAYLRSLLARYPVEADAVAAYNAGAPRRGADGRYLNQAYVDQVMLYDVWYQNHLPGERFEPVPATSDDWLVALFGAPEAETPPAEALEEEPGGLDPLVLAGLAALVVGAVVVTGRAA